MNSAQNTSSENEVFVRNLPFSASPDTLKAFFKTSGNIENISLPKGPDGRSKGIAFVRFSDTNGVDKAITLSGTELEGRTLFIEKKKPRPEGDEGRRSPQKQFNDNRREKVFSRAEPRDQGISENEIFIRNFPFTTDEEDLEDFFKGVGTIEGIKILRGPDGASKGSAFVKFSDEQGVTKALELDGRDLQGRSLQVQKRRPREEGNFRPQRTDNRGGSPNRNATSVFVGGLSFSTTEDSLRKYFGACGNITAVRVAVDHEGQPKGFAHIDFESSDSVDKAIAKSDSELDGKTIRVDRATDKRSGGRGGFRGGSRGGSRGGFRGSRGGDRGGRGGFGRGRGGYSNNF